MKKLLLTLLLSIISSQSIGAVEDVYFCNITKFVDISADKDIIKYKPTSLKFQWKEESIAFSGGSWLGTSEVPIVAQPGYKVDFIANDQLNTVIHFGDGILRVAFHQNYGIYSIIAECSTF